MERKDWENFMEEVVSTVKEGLNRLAQKTDQLTQIGRLKLDIISIKREIEKEFTELGGRVYELHKEGAGVHPFDDEKIKQSLETLNTLEERLQAKKDEIERVSQAERQQEAQKESRKEEPELAEADAPGSNSHEG